MFQLSFTRHLCITNVLLLLSRSFAHALLINNISYWVEYRIKKKKKKKKKNRLISQGRIQDFYGGGGGGVVVGGGVYKREPNQKVP